MFDNHKGKNKKFKRASQAIKKLYKKIPPTKGCMKWLNKSKDEGGCGAWCCEHQNPQVLQIEFLRTWEHVLDNWEGEKIADLIELAMNNYLTSRPTKGCIFWNRSNGTCSQHETRPYNCRIYGITPEEEFKPRYERLKVLYQDRPDAIIRDQCDLVETENGEKVTTKMTQDWWEEAVEIEQMMGVDKKDIHDGSGGTYLTYHDHLLLQVCNNNLMAQLQHLRLHGNDIEKNVAVNGMMKAFRKALQGYVDEDDQSEGS